jgi:hypothetical protein
MNSQKEVNCCKCGNRFWENSDIAFFNNLECHDCRRTKMLQTIEEDKAKYGTYRM